MYSSDSRKANAKWALFVGNVHKCGRSAEFGTPATRFVNPLERRPDPRKVPDLSYLVLLVIEANN
jgi:hypothetical protein